MMGYKWTASRSTHINEVNIRIHYSLHSLKRLEYFLPFRTKIMLALTLLLPKLDYADVFYLDVTGALLNKLERLQNLAVRFIYGLLKYDCLRFSRWVKMAPNSYTP